jgi:hypothetical protein
MHGQQNIKFPIIIVGNIYYSAMNVMDEIDYEYVLSLKVAFRRNLLLMIT